MKNYVIEVLNIEHGKKVRQYFYRYEEIKHPHSFTSNREDDDTYRFYGFINNTFDNYKQSRLQYNTEIITLEEAIQRKTKTSNPVEKSLNYVIEVLDSNHAKEVKEYFTSFLTTKFSFDNTKTRNSHNRFYGFINGDFNCFSSKDIVNHNVPIMTLKKKWELKEVTQIDTSATKDIASRPEILIQKPMMVWDDDESKAVQRVVIKKTESLLPYVVWQKGRTIEEVADVSMITHYKNAKELEVITMTKKEIADKLNIPVEYLEIVHS